MTTQTFIITLPTLSVTQAECDAALVDGGDESFVNSMSRLCKDMLHRAVFRHASEPVAWQYFAKSKECVVVPDGMPLQVVEQIREMNRRVFDSMRGSGV